MQQPPAAGNKVDIVFVADTSGSMADEQDAVAAALDRLIAGIDPQGDYHIGVLPAHGSLGPSTGLLWKGEIDLCPTCQTTTPPDAGQSLADKFRDLRSDPSGSDPAADGGEMGIYSLHRMVTDRLTAPENAGFVRPDAALAVIFLSDENDICAYPPLLSPAQTAAPDFRKFDPQGAEAAEYARSCASIAPDGSNVLHDLLALKADQPVFVGGILYNTLGDSQGRYARLTDPSLEDAGPEPCPAPDQYVKTLVTGGAVFTWRGDTSCTACSLNIQRFDESLGMWGKISGSRFSVLRNTTFTHNFGIVPRFGRGIYRFTYQRFHSGDSGPPKLAICNFDVVAP